MGWLPCRPIYVTISFSACQWVRATNSIYLSTLTFTGHPSQYCIGTCILCTWQRLTFAQYACTKMTTSSAIQVDLKFCIPAKPGFAVLTWTWDISNEGKIKEMQFLLSIDIKYTKLKLCCTTDVIQFNVLYQNVIQFTFSNIFIKESCYFFTCYSTLYTSFSVGYYWG